SLASPGAPQLVPPACTLLLLKKPITTKSYGCYTIPFRRFAKLSKHSASTGSGKGDLIFGEVPKDGLLIGKGSIWARETCTQSHEEHETAGVSERSEIHDRGLVAGAAAGKSGPGSVRAEGREARAAGWRGGGREFQGAERALGP